MTFEEILNLGLMVLALINICQAGYHRWKDNTPEATFHVATAATLYLLATH